MAQDEEISKSAKLAFSICIGAIAILFMLGLIYLLVLVKPAQAYTKYTVTITSVDGLHLHGDRQALNPVFGITVLIDNTNNTLTGRCVGGIGASAVVSYGDALLGKGTMPRFCAQTTGVEEAAAKAWGMDVQVPQFLWDRLAGELERGQAVVDVAVRTPGGGGCNIFGCLDTVLVCKAKIGGGPSPCYRAEIISATPANT